MLKGIRLLSWRIVFSIFVSVVAGLIMVIIIMVPFSLLSTFVWELSVDQIGSLITIFGNAVSLVIFILALYAGYRYGWRNKRFIKTPRESGVDSE